MLGGDKNINCVPASRGKKAWYDNWCAVVNNISRLMSRNVIPPCITSASASQHIPQIFCCKKLDLNIYSSTCKYLGDPLQTKHTPKLK